MIIEAIVIASLSLWVYNEYVYNLYFQIYVNSVFVEHFTTYTIAFGLGVGLAGTAIAATLYKNLQEAKVRLGSVGPKIRGSVGKMLASVPSVENQGATIQVGNAQAVATQPEQTPTSARITSPVSPPSALEEKK